MPAVTGAALSHYSVTLQNGVLRVADTAIAIQVSSGKPRFEHLALTATVSATGTPPTGMVTFKEGATVLGGGTLSSGSFTIDASQLTMGKHVVTVEYSGDATYSGMISDPFAFYRSPKPH